MYNPKDHKLNKSNIFYKIIKVLFGTIAAYFIGGGAIVACVWVVPVFLTEGMKPDNQPALIAALVFFIPVIIIICAGLLDIAKHHVQKQYDRYVVNREPEEQEKLAEFLDKNGASIDQVKKC